MFARTPPFPYAALFRSVLSADHHHAGLTPAGVRLTIGSTSLRRLALRASHFRTSDRVNGTAVNKVAHAAMRRNSWIGGGAPDCDASQLTTEIHNGKGSE